MIFSERKRLLFFGLPFTFTRYEISDEMITVKKGLLRMTEDDAYLYKIVDVRLEMSLMERLFRLGTVHCFGGDVTSPDLVLCHIHRAREIKDYILKQSEVQRRKRRTINTQHIDMGDEAQFLDDFDDM